MPNVRETTTFLSESDNGRNIRVLAAAAPAATLVHSVPDGESHEITLYAVNPSTTSDEITGTWGGTDPIADVLNFSVDGESTGPALFENCMLVGPSEIRLRSKVADIFVFGKVVTFKDVSP